MLKLVATVLSLFGVNTQSPTAPTNPIGALLWQAYRQFETAVGAPPPLAGTPTIGTPDPTTGTVTGTLGFTNPSGQGLAYTVSANPTQGVVNVDSTGGYTYTPTTAARYAATASTTDTFTVTATNANGSAAETVTVAVSPLVDKPVAGTPTVNTPDSATGVVTGALNITDPAGKALSYNVSSQPTQGSVTVTTTGAFTYTPTTAARLAAGQSTAPITDTFTVTATNGTASTPEQVTIPVAPATLTASSNISVAGVGYPTSEALSRDGKTLYVSSYPSSGNGVVSVIDTATNTVTATISVPPLTAIALAGAYSLFPTSMVLSPDGKTLYVTSSVSDSGQLSVINTTTNAVVATEALGGSDEPSAVTISPDGTKLYVADYTGTVSVINTTTTNDGVPAPSVITDISVGAPDLQGIAVSPDGDTVYVSSGGGGVDSVSVIDAATNQVTGTITVGNHPIAMAFSPDAAHLYVQNYSDESLSVIDTATNQVSTTITGVTYPVGVAVSPDGSALYVPADLGAEVSVISVARNTAVATSTNPNYYDANDDGGGTPTVVVGPDGTVYVLTSNASGGQPTVSVFSVVPSTLTAQLA
ncbi:beta-propeller fold lactonase family protein [Mycolicibacterium sphagni]|uniref:beta-propeller fold lactonase family protein n=1 Tax=Mycolicibacterium sphagni TaxID=1786 RepID=UPI0013FE47C7|nr:beta-propeller fold lactonase family protein [Mycolicibacterium sphagni]